MQITPSKKIFFYPKPPKPQNLKTQFRINSSSNKLISINGIIRNSNEIIETASEIMSQ